MYRVHSKMKNSSGPSRMPRGKTRRNVQQLVVALYSILSQSVILPKIIINGQRSNVAYATQVPLLVSYLFTGDELGRCKKLLKLVDERKENGPDGKVYSDEYAHFLRLWTSGRSTEQYKDMPLSILTPFISNACSIDPRCESPQLCCSGERQYIPTDADDGYLLVTCSLIDEAVRQVYPPTISPTSYPSLRPTPHPSLMRSGIPSAPHRYNPTGTPTIASSTKPSSGPSHSPIPSLSLSRSPSVKSSAPPTFFLTGVPSSIPTKSPSHVISTQPSNTPSILPIQYPSRSPSVSSGKTITVVESWLCGIIYICTINRSALHHSHTIICFTVITFSPNAMGKVADRVCLSNTNEWNRGG